MTGRLGCPECETLCSFTLLHVTGRQTGAVFVEQGKPVLASAGSINVDKYDRDQLRCTNCGQVVSADDLVTIDEEAPAR